jgi:hypothetical protein
MVGFPMRRLGLEVPGTGSGDTMPNSGGVPDALPGMGGLDSATPAWRKIGPYRACRTKLSERRHHRHQESAVVGFWPGFRWRRP